MPLTGAEKQRRYWQRLKDRAAAASPQAPPDPEEVARLQKLIARVRRAMPRNRDVMALCDAVEQRSRL
jgi:hypothetical protein